MYPTRECVGCDHVIEPGDAVVFDGPDDRYHLGCEFDEVHEEVSSDG